MATSARDPYEVLGVPRDADETQIKKAFRRLARELHPDVNRHDPDAEEKFKEAAEAYEILNDAERRALYDRYGHDGLRSGGYAPNFEGFGSISDLFDAFCGGAGVLQAVSRSPFGQVVRQTACDVCHGEGKVASEPCENCDGRGREVRR